MDTKERLTSTKILTDEIDAIYSTLGAEAAVPEIRKLAEMKVRSKIHRFDEFQREELIEDCLLAACSGKFRGINKDQKPVRYSTWVFRVIDNKVNNVIRARISRRKQESIHRNPCDLSLLGDKDRKLAFFVSELREHGATFKDVARKLNASGILGKNINHAALRRRVARLLKKAEVLPEVDCGRDVTPGTHTSIPYAP